MNTSRRATVFLSLFFKMSWPSTYEEKETTEINIPK